MNYALEAQIAKEMQELMGKKPEVSVAEIKKVLQNIHNGPRSAALVQANAVEWLTFLVDLVEAEKKEVLDYEERLEALRKGVRKATKALTNSSEMGE
jgi:hypothetical protein